MSNIIGRAQAEVYEAHHEPANDNRLPASMAREPFTLFHYPWAWVWHDKHGFLPDVGKVEHKPGVNGVTGNPGQRPNATMAVNRVMQNGAQVFRVGDSALGPWRNYLVSYPTNLGQKTGKHFTFNGDEFEKLGRNEAKQLGRGENWWAFLVYLRDESGRIDPMPQSVFNKLMDIEEVRLDRLSGRKGAEEKAEASRKRMAAMRAFWQKRWAPDEPSPVPVLLSASSVEADPLSGEAMTPAVPVAPGKSRGKPTRREDTDHG